MHATAPKDVTMPELTTAELRAALDVALAQRDRALAIVDRLEHAHPAGYSTGDVQNTLREARALLEETGTRKSVAPPVWRDRR